MKRESENRWYNLFTLCRLPTVYVGYYLQTARPDFLQLLINASQDMDKSEIVQDDMISHKQIEGGKRIPLTEHEIISQCFLFLIAGYETTAVSMTNTAYLLAQFPEAQEKCYQEIMDTVGNEVT